MINALKLLADQQKDGDSRLKFARVAMVSSGVDTYRQFLLCWHASQCPWHRRGRCLFRHRGADADVKPPVTRTEEEIWVELAALGKTVSKSASSMMWRTGHFVDVSRAESHEEPTMKQFDDLPVPHVVEDTVERTDGWHRRVRCWSPRGAGEGGRRRGRCRTRIAL